MLVVLVGAQHLPRWQHGQRFSDLSLG